MLEEIAAQCRDGARYYWIEFWGHGGSGSFAIGDDSYSSSAFLSACARHGISRDSFCNYDRFSGRCPLIWFRTCQTAKGAAGERFMRAIADELQVTVFAYEESISDVQPGLCQCKPGCAIERNIGCTMWTDTRPF
jgi:hypothetical protein